MWFHLGNRLIQINCLKLKIMMTFTSIAHVQCINFWSQLCILFWLLWFREKYRVVGGHKCQSWSCWNPQKLMGKDKGKRRQNIPGGKKKCTQFAKPTLKVRKVSPFIFRLHLSPTYAVKKLSLTQFGKLPPESSHIYVYWPLSKLDLVPAISVSSLLFRKVP